MWAFSVTGRRTFFSSIVCHITGISLMAADHLIAVLRNFKLSFHPVFYFKRLGNSLIILIFRCIYSISYVMNKSLV
jgi:hypothetical protein